MNKNILPTTEGQRLIDHAKNRGGSFTIHVLEPGEVEAYFGHYPLSEIYDLSSPGTYRISATMHLGGMRIASNEIEITVEKPPSKWW